MQKVMVLLQVIPRQLCDNAGFDATDVLNKLRQKHALPSGWLSIFLYACGMLACIYVLHDYLHACRHILICLLVTGEGGPYGVDIATGGIADSFANFVWEPAIVKVSACIYLHNYISCF